jgi:hypothetical protein
MGWYLVKRSSKFFFLFSVASEVCAAAPWLSMVLFIALAAASRFTLGDWPTYGNFWELTSSSHLVGALDMAFNLWTLFSLLGFPVILLGFRPFGPTDESRRKRHAMTFLIGWVAFLVLFCSDPFGFTSAFID